MNAKKCLLGAMLLLSMVQWSNGVAADGVVAVDLMPAYCVRGSTPFALHFIVSGLSPNTDYTYTARFFQSGNNRGSFWTDNSGGGPYGWGLSYSTLGNTGPGTELSTWAYVKPGDTLSPGPALLRIRVKVKGTSDTPDGYDFSITVIDPSSAGFLHNAIPTGHGGRSVVEIRDSGGTLVGLVLSEPNLINDDSHGGVDDEDYGPLGREGDFRAAVPSGIPLATYIDGVPFAPSETVSPGQEKGIPTLPVISISTPVVRYDWQSRTLSITGVTAACSIHGVFTATDPPPEGPAVHMFTILSSEGTPVLSSSLTHGGDSWNAYEVDLSSLEPGTYSVRAAFQDDDASGQSEPSHPFIVFNTIREAKSLPNGMRVNVVGTVTSPPGIFYDSDFYLQDETAGIRIFVPGGVPLPLSIGDVVSVSGVMDEKRGEREIGNAALTPLGTGIAPSPRLLPTVASMLEENEGTLVAVSGARVIGIEGRAFFLDDGSGSAKVSLFPRTGISITHYPGFGTGAVVEVVGVVGQRYSLHEIKPRFASDIRVIFSAPVPLSVQNAHVLTYGMRYLAEHNMARAQALESRAKALFQSAQERHLDVEVCGDTMYEGATYLFWAREALAGNPIAANNYALHAIALFERAIACLEALLG